MNLSALDKSSISWDQYGSQLKDHIYERSRRCFAAGNSQRDTLSNTEEVVRRQRRIREKILECVGGLPPSESPLAVRNVGVIHRDGFDLEKIVFQSRPYHYVTANLYLPHERPERCPAILFLCGHHEQGKHADEYQGVCQTLVQAGLIVLAQDPIGQGERFSYYDSETKRAIIPPCCPDHDQAGMPAVMIGQSLARYFLHDAMRGVDYLLTRSDVDADRIGVTGNSGGGTQTALMMMADSRIAAAAPATFITSRASYQNTGGAQDSEQIWRGFTSSGFDHEDILLAMAPKPVCVLAVTSDFFPIEGTRTTVSRSRRIWELFEREEALTLVEDHNTHKFTPKLAQSAAEFFALHLCGRKIDASRFAVNILPQGMLWCTKTGQVSSEFDDAQFIHEANRNTLFELRVLRAERMQDEHAEVAEAWLREQVYAGREDCDLNPRFLDACYLENFRVEPSFWWPQHDLTNSGLLFRESSKSNVILPVTIAVWDNGTTALSSHTHWLKMECNKGRAVLVLNVVGVGPLVPQAINLAHIGELYGTFYKLQDDLSWMDDSLVALRTYHVLRAINLIRQWPGVSTEGLTLYAHGQEGLYAHLAAFLDRRIFNCEWEDRFTSREFVESRFYDTQHIKKLTLPGVLRYFDFDDLDVWKQRRSPEEHPH